MVTTHCWSSAVAVSGPVARTRRLLPNIEASNATSRFVLRRPK
ncbi:hypothetical protein AHF37_10080 [Paragonimus kellicotti]|nr:hypothetical protein AHF37_10080 [Paragonimus kellicotti]